MAKQLFAHRSNRNLVFAGICLVMFSGFMGCQREMASESNPSLSHNRTSLNTEQDDSPGENTDVPLPIENDGNAANEFTFEQENETPAEIPTEKGMLEKAGDLLGKAKTKGAQAARGTGKWVSDTLGSAKQSSEKTIENSMEWATDTFNALKDQGLTTASNTTEWLSEDWSNMDRWEYKVIKLEAMEPAVAASQLNELGSDGWECFQVTGEGVCFLKKPSHSYLRSLPFKDVIKLVPLMNAAGGDDGK